MLCMVVFLKNYTKFQTKMVKTMINLQTKPAQKKSDTV